MPQERSDNFWSRAFPRLRVTGGSRVFWMTYRSKSGNGRRRGEAVGAIEFVAVGIGSQH